ncbi:hypothetical protein D3C71_1247050 [compost metagenome]
MIAVIGENRAAISRAIFEHFSTTDHVTVRSFVGPFSVGIKERTINSHYGIIALG